MAQDWKDKLATIAGYAGGLTILVWALLKATGVINTPIWIEMIPYASAAIAALAFVYKAGKLVNRFEVIEGDVHALKDGFSEIKTQVSGIGREITSLKESQKRLTTIVLQKA